MRQPKKLPYPKCSNIMTYAETLVKVNGQEMLPNPFSYRLSTRTERCDRGVPIKLKGKFHRANIRPTMLYRADVMQ